MKGQYNSSKGTFAIKRNEALNSVAAFKAIALTFYCEKDRTSKSKTQKQCLAQNLLIPLKVL